MADTGTSPTFLQGGGEMGQRIRAFDWAAHPLGPPRHWPQALQMAMSLCLNSNFPTAVYWGPSLYVLYNDAWSQILADRHPAALGREGAQLWSDIWAEVGPGFEQVMTRGEGLAVYDVMLPMVRYGQARETYWNYSLTPIRDADNAVAGVFNQGNEVTERVLSRRKRQAELQRWRELFRQAPAGIALVRGPNHVYELVNDAYAVLVGGRDVLNKSVREALPEVESQGFIALLDRVYRSGEPHVGKSIQLKLQRSPEGPLEDCMVDFVYEPVRDAAGNVDGIFILVTDVTERARAENALRISNWQLREERERLDLMVQAEQRAQAALRRFNDTLEAHVRQRTAQLTQALEHEGAVSARLRATFETRMIFQGYMDPAGVLLDANALSLEAVGCTLGDVVGRLFWNTPWFTSTPGMSERVKDGVRIAARGLKFEERIRIELPGGTREFDFSLRPVFNARREVVGIVPEALDLTPRREAA